MDYIDKLELQTEEAKEVETLEKHTITINKPFTVDEYLGHEREFLAVDGDYNDGFNLLSETNGLAENCIVSKEVKEARTDVNGNSHASLKDRINSDINVVKCEKIYLSDYKDRDDWSPLFNEMCSSIAYKIIECEADKEYCFKSTVNLNGRVVINGNGCNFRWLGSLTSDEIMFKFNVAPWVIEKSMFDHIKFWCGEGNTNSYSKVICFQTDGGHTLIKWTNCIFYNFGYPIRLMKTSTNSWSYGHSIVDCSFWGFITGVHSQQNNEQVLIQHCWFDDGIRNNANLESCCISVYDATSFWIRDNVLQSTDYGIKLLGVKSGIIDGNHFENMIKYSLYFDPCSSYDNHGCEIRSNYLCGGLACVYFKKPEWRKNKHNTFSTNIGAYVGSGQYVFDCEDETSARYNCFYNNSMTTEVQNTLGKTLYSPNIKLCVSEFLNQ